MDPIGFSYIIHGRIQLSKRVVPFPAIHHKCCLLSRLLILFGSLYCKQYVTKSDCSWGSSLIWVHIVIFHGISFFLECIWIYTTDVISRHFSGKNISRIKFKMWYLDARNPVFRGLQTTKAQTSLHVWSAPFLFAYWKVSYLDFVLVKF